MYPVSQLLEGGIAYVMTYCMIVKKVQAVAVWTYAVLQGMCAMAIQFNLQEGVHVKEFKQESPIFFTQGWRSSWCSTAFEP